MGSIEQSGSILNSKGSNKVDINRYEDEQKRSEVEKEGKKNNWKCGKFEKCTQDRPARKSLVTDLWFDQYEVDKLNK